MTLEELRKTGKDGVYDAARDEYFIKGEEPVPVTAAPAKPPVGRVDAVAADPAFKPADEAKTDTAPAKKAADVKTTDIKTTEAGKK